MFIFLGDSFTWGQGLYFENWIKHMAPREISKFTPNSINHETFSFQDHEYRKTHRFPYLVAKHYNTPYLVPTITNGGSNYDIYYELKSLKLPRDLPYLFVIQLTEFSRMVCKANPDDLGKWYKEKDESMIHEYLEFKSEKHMRILEKKLKESQINLFVSYINELKESWSDKIDFIFCNWQPDYIQYCSKSLHDKFVEFEYNGKKYKSFDFLTRNGYSLSSSLKIFDKHLNSEGHQFVADSIIKKIDTMNIDFIRPK